MPENSNHALAPMVRKLSMREPLEPADREAIFALPFTRRTLQAGQYLVWDGDRPQNTCLLLSGYAYRHKHAGNGGRQIMSIHMKGDIVDLPRMGAQHRAARRPHAHCPLVVRIRATSPNRRAWASDRL